jgi:uncharacterized membrane protein YhaH (DUF805 family)
MQWHENLNSVMESDTIKKNGANLKSLLSKENFWCNSAWLFIMVVFLFMITACAKEDAVPPIPSAPTGVAFQNL